ncbi:hypothetical protein DH2020_005366 [Rehmannia glutinosa]|uniref:Uncharacterized protein n=1 Tax=Rehmannia glutinosa TaxID=99300 RepID=A0ABR0XFV8_REHGL
MSSPCSSPFEKCLHTCDDLANGGASGGCGGGGLTGPNRVHSSAEYVALTVSGVSLPSKSDRFVPPHLRPGFVGREEKPGSELVKAGQGSIKVKPELRVHRPGQFQGPGHNGLETIDGRPKSGGGHEPMRRGRELADLNRPGSSGTRPSSSG